jgi:hypothetical protein
MVNAFNPATLNGLMCHTLSVSWDGKLYDCDFNQMLDLPIDNSVIALIYKIGVQTSSRKTLFWLAGGGRVPHCGGALTDN